MNYSYGYDKIINQTSGITKQKLQGSGASFGADWKAKVSKFQLDATGEITPGSARLAGTNLQGNLSYKKDSLFSIKASVLLNSKSPNFNFLLHQSTYDEYNWENDFENIRTQNLGFQIDSRWLNAAVNLTNIENYTYFDENNKPQQYSENVTYLRKKEKLFSQKKSTLKDDNENIYNNCILLYITMYVMNIKKISISNNI